VALAPCFVGFWFLVLVFGWFELVLLFLCILARDDSGQQEDTKQCVQ
jgi:hypothetical protein